MIRWNYVAPRLAILVTLWAAITWGLDPSLRWALIQLGQSSVGARVEVSSLHSVLRAGSVQVDRIAVADPRAPMKNLVEGDQTALQLDTNALLQKKFIVTDGHISGLRFGTPRKESGALPGSPPATDAATDGSWIPQQIERLGDDWLQSRTKQIESELKDSLQSIQVANELTDRWPKTYDQMESDVKDIARQTEELIGYVKQTTDNPLRALEVCRDAATRAEALRQRSVNLRDRLAGLKQQIQQDKQALILARKHDEALIRQHANLEAFNPEVISKYLVGPELAPHVATAVNWIRWFRQQFPGKDAPVALSPRGTDIVFRGLPASPDFLVRRLALDGTGILGNQPVKFVGEATGLTTQLSQSDKPMTLRLQSQGSILAELHATRELQENRVRDFILVNCPQLPVPARQLGKSDQLALQVSQGQAHVWSKLELIEDELQGEIILKQEGVAMHTTAVPSSIASFQPSLDQVLSSLESVEVLVRIHGPLRAPELQLRSNLGPHVTQAVHGAVERELHARAQGLLQDTQAKIEQQLADAETKVLNQQRELLDKLQIGDDQIKGLVAEVASRMGISQRYFNTGRMLDNFLRR